MRSDPSGVLCLFRIFLRHSVLAKSQNRLNMDASNGDQRGSYEEPSPTEPSKEMANKPSGYGDSAATNHMVNGISSSSSSKEHKSHSSHGDKSKSSSSHHSSSSSKSKHSSSSSSSKDPSKHSSSSNNKDPSKHSSSSSRDPSKHSSSSSKDSSRHSSSSSKDPSKHSSSSSKHSSSHKSHSSSKDPSKSSSSSSHRHSSSKHHSSSSGDKKHHSSSSSGEKKHHSSSSGDKHKSSSNGEKHKSSSSSDKHKSSSSSDKHKSSSSSSDKHKSSSQEDKNKKHNAENKPVVEGKVDAIKSVLTEESEFKMEAKAISPLKLSIKKEVKKEPEVKMEDSDDDKPLTARVEKVKEEVRSPTGRSAKRAAIVESDDDDDAPLSARKEQVKKVKKEVKTEITAVKRKRDMDDDGPKKKKKKEPVSKTKPVASPTKKKKKDEKQEEDKWKWWEEGPRESGCKWNTLEHQGPVFAPEYDPLPDDVKFYYDGKEMKLSHPAEEVAGFYARMLDHDYTARDIFNQNFLKDWRKTMTSEEKSKITDLNKCNFREYHAFFMAETEKRKNRTKEEKLELKNQNQALMDEYGWCIIDGHKQKIGNFRIEPPGLFRGRGDHPKQGMLKTRTMPEDVIINCSKNVEPPKPPKGRRWKEVRHDNTVTWLACWQENVQGSTKYVMLNAASRLKGEKDWMKYETARNLHKCADKIRAQYHEDWKSKEMRIRQRAVALYFIDKLALRAGNEKDEDTADTVGCCSLRVEHLTLHEEMGGKQYVVEFDFLGKDSIRYYNSVPVEKRVFKNLQLFVDNKAPGDDVFDRLNTSILNKHLQCLMDGLTAKVFRTFNASKTLQEQLDLLTNADDNVAAKMLSYNRANRAVAVLCNHQRAAPKNFSTQMENLQKKIEDKKEQIKEAKRDLKSLKADLKATKSVKSKTLVEKKKKAIERLEDQLNKLEVSATDKDENKEIALGTSKLNYLDPRISVAWCKKFDVPIEKVYNKTQREKFAWAIDMADEEYVF